jgi:SPP1 family predicted phage head-tail adaptor
MGIASRYRHTLTIERASSGTVTPRGHAAQTWTALATVQGLVQERSGHEVEGPDHTAIISNALIFLPSDTAVTERDRVRHGDRLYELLFVRDPGAKGRHLEIDARRVTP